MSDFLDFPAEAPVMTLPNTVLFPHAFLPLYIFEPRYRQMLAEVLQSNRCFAIAGLDPERAQEPDQLEPPYAVAALGMVRACHENPDGTSNLILQGVARVKLTGIVAETPYRRCSLEVLATAPGAAEAELRRQRLGLLHQLEELRGLNGQISDEVMTFLRTLREPEIFLDLAAFTVCQESQEKQRLLEELDTTARFTRFLRHLRSESTRLSLVRKLQGPLRDEDVSRN